MLKEFKEFVIRGNILDLAIGIIIGVAFGKIVTDFVNYVLMPPIGLLLGKIDFSSLFISLNGQAYPSLDAATKVGAPVIGYGVFINDIINFIILAFVVFLIARWVIRMRKSAPVPTSPATKECPYCASSIPAKATRCPDFTSQL